MSANVSSRWASYEGGSAGTTKINSPPARGRAGATTGGLSRGAEAGELASPVGRTVVSGGPALAGVRWAIAADTLSLAVVGM